MRDIIEKAIAESARFGADFVDIRIEKRVTQSITLREGVPQVSSGIDYGVAVRVFRGGAMGFSYTAIVSLESILNALERAAAMARAAQGKAKNPQPVTLKAIEAYHEWPEKRSVLDVSAEVKLSDLLELDKLLSQPEYVKSRTITYTETVEHKFYGSSEGRFIEEKRSLTTVAANVFGYREGIVASAHRRIGTIKGYVLWEKENMEDFANALLRRVESQLRATTPRAGVYPVILGPEAVGVFVHEAFGHLAEADLVASGSVLRGKQGEIVASEKVTIVDDPMVDDGFGTMRYDDEGVGTAKVVIVEKGVHKQIMTSRVYAAQFDTEPTGNARAESYRYAPIVRMRNTLMMPGDSSLEEMLESIERGYYIVATAGGQTNIDGSFQVGVQEAYEIVNGEIGNPIRNMSISGNTIETLKNIDLVGKDLAVHYGYCGKGQVVPVSLGGPHVRVKKITVGGRA